MILCAASNCAIVQLNPLRDTTLYESATGALGNGAGQFLFAGTTNQPQLRRALISFDTLSIVPTGAVIESVSLRMHVASASPLFNSFTLHRVTSAWTTGASDASGNEGSGTAAQNGDATWLHASSVGTLWSNAGGDFDSSSSASLIVGDLGWYTWTSSQLAADVQQWIDHPESSMGWMLRGDETAIGSTRRFDSSESLTPALAPQLVIEYSIVPAPASLALLTVSTLLVATRRRRRV